MKDKLLLFLIVGILIYIPACKDQPNSPEENYIINFKYPANPANVFDTVNIRISIDPTFDFHYGELVIDPAQLPINFTTREFNYLWRTPIDSIKKIYDIKVNIYNNNREKFTSGVLTLNVLPFHPPNKFNIETISESSVKISWELPGIDFDTAYVEKYNSESNWEIFNQLSNNTNFFNDYGLNKYSDYQYRIKYKRGNYETDYSNVITLTYGLQPLTMKKRISLENMQINYSRTGKYFIGIFNIKPFITLFDSESGNLIRSFEFFDYNKIMDVKVSDDGKKIAAIVDSNLAVWDIDSDSPNFIDNSGNSICADISPTGNIFCGKANGNIYKYKSEDYSLINIINSSTESVSAIVTSPSGDFVCAGYSDGITKIWDNSSYELISTLSDLGDEIAQITISPNGGLICIGNSSSIRIYNYPELSVIDGYSRSASTQFSYNFANNVLGLWYLYEFKLIDLTTNNEIHEGTFYYWGFETSTYGALHPTKLEMAGYGSDPNSYAVPFGIFKFGIENKWY